MNHDEKRVFLIRALLDEQSRYRGLDIPSDAGEQKQLLRSLLNIRRPGEISESFILVQNEYLQEETAEKGITELSDLKPLKKGIYLWQGDITTLSCDAIVNAANGGMTGCYIPCHGCIDNCIHTYAGVQLRNKCAEIMKIQGHEEPPGGAKITPGYNLPCKYVIHTVGPIITGGVTNRDENLLASCYRSCLEIAETYKCRSIAFCCISTGEFRFPNARAAEIAVQTVMKHKSEKNSKIKVIFNVFKDIDNEIYRVLLE